MQKYTDWLSFSVDVTMKSQQNTLDENLLNCFELLEEFSRDISGKLL